MYIRQHSSSVLLAKAYDKHRWTRNNAKRELLMLTKEVVPDMLLRGVALEGQPPEFDPRNCISLWCRPTSDVSDLIEWIQKRLLDAVSGSANCSADKSLPKITTSGGHSRQKKFADWQDRQQKMSVGQLDKNTDDVDGRRHGLWIMPRENLHMTALEVVHSAPEEVVRKELDKMRFSLDRILRAPSRGSILVKPILSYDQSALALSFIPACPDDGLFDLDEPEDYEYTYHHLRRDLDLETERAGVQVMSRYQLPSAHVTIARFVGPFGCSMDKWFSTIDSINTELDLMGQQGAKGTIWRVGEEYGIEARCGRIWYGGGYAAETGHVR